MREQRLNFMHYSNHAHNATIFMCGGSYETRSSNRSIEHVRVGFTPVALLAQATGGRPVTQAELNGGAHYQAVSWHDDDRDSRAYGRDRNGRGERHEQARSYRGDRDKGSYNRYYGRNYYANDGYRDSYAEGGYYPGATYYDGSGYSQRDLHAGRSAAIIAGSAGAGAVLGAAAGRGQGAAIGAIVGGIAGVIADQAVRRHDYR
jgi:hypothetical protein